MQRTKGLYSDMTLGCLIFKAIFSRGVGVGFPCACPDCLAFSLGGGHPPIGGGCAPRPIPLSVSVSTQSHGGDAPVSPVPLGDREAHPLLSPRSIAFPLKSVGVRLSWWCVCVALFHWVLGDIAERMSSQMHFVAIPLGITEVFA
jgi:hypothetical protein